MPDFFPAQVPLWVKMLFVLAMVFGGLANAAVYAIVHQLNQRKPDCGKRYSYYLWYWQKMRAVFREYETEFPQGRKAFWYKIFFLVGALAFISWFLLSIWYVSLKPS